MSKKLIKKLFWSICLPSALISMALCLLNGIDPFNNIICVSSIMSLAPMLMIKIHELQDKTMENLVLEFRKMESTEFLNFMEEFRKIPLGDMRSLYKEAYQQEYLRRYNKDIFHNIPSFGS